MLKPLKKSEGRYRKFSKTMPSFSKVVLLTRSAHWNILCVPGLRTSHQIYSTSRVDGTLGVLIFTWVETATSEDQVRFTSESTMQIICFYRFSFGICFLIFDVAQAHFRVLKEILVQKEIFIFFNKIDCLLLGVSQSPVLSHTDLSQPCWLIHRSTP